MIEPASVLAALAADEQAVVVAIVLSRLFLPLLIPRFPLVIIAALILDAIDGSLLENLTSVDTGPDGPYQSFDKALDIYYLAIAYLTMMRNWSSHPAFRIGQFLFYYRLVGVLLFELLDSRAMLLLFPNTFEFYFIAYEVIRMRFDPSRGSPRLWLAIAAGLWVFVKLPQEYWIHIAQLDFTETVADHPWFGVLCAAVVLGLIAVFAFVVRPRLPEPDARWRIAADPLPASLAEAHARHAHRLQRGGVLWAELGEKIALLGLISIIFAAILPDVEVVGDRGRARRRGDRLRQHRDQHVVRPQRASDDRIFRRGLRSAARGQPRADLSREPLDLRPRGLPAGHRAVLRVPDHADALALRRLQAGV